MNFHMYFIGFCCLVASVLVTPATAARDIHDPLDIFCGKDNCYDIIGVPKTSSLDDIKKAYRRLSLAHHPDKNSGTVEQSTVTFQKISKAFEVLKGNESRPLFDYYLAHPWDYYKVSGKHFMRNPPTASVGVVVLFVLLALSAVMYHSQQQKHTDAVRFLRNAVMNNLGPRNGGTQYTQDLFDAVAVEYNAAVAAATPGKKVKVVPKARMLADPLFAEVTDRIVNAVEIEGSARKPQFDDILIVWLTKAPLKLLGMGGKTKKQ